MHCIICGAGGCACGPSAPLRYPPLGSGWTSAAELRNIMLVQNTDTTAKTDELKTDALAPVTSEAAQSNMPVFGTGTPTEQTGPVYVAEERLYLDGDGLVVHEDDPARVSLLLGVGGKMPRALAQTYGLIATESAPAVVASPAENVPDENAGQP